MQARFRPHLGLGWGPASWDLGGCKSSGLEGSRVSSHQVVPNFSQSQGWPAPGTASWQEVLPRDAWTPQTGHPPWGQSLQEGPLGWCRAGRVWLGRSQGLSFQTPSHRRRELLAWLPPLCLGLGLGAAVTGTPPGTWCCISAQ